MNIDPIKCSTPGCPQFMSNPCGSITSLFALKETLERIIADPNNSIDRQRLTEQIDDVTNHLKKGPLTDWERHFIGFQKSSIRDVVIPTKKTLTLECSLGHRNIYVIDCD